MPPAIERFRSFPIQLRSGPTKMRNLARIDDSSSWHCSERRVWKPAGRRNHIRLAHWDRCGSRRACQMTVGRGADPLQAYRRHRVGSGSQERNDTLRVSVPLNTVHRSTRRKRSSQRRRLRCKVMARNRHQFIYLFSYLLIYLFIMHLLI